MLFYQKPVTKNTGDYVVYDLLLTNLVIDSLFNLPHDTVYYTVTRPCNATTKFLMPMNVRF